MSGPEKADKPSTSVLQLNHDNYSLQYPESWLAQAQDNNWVLISDPNNRNAFILSIRSFKPTEANLDSMATAAVNSLGMFKNVKLLSKDKFTVSGAKDAVLLSGTATFQDGGNAIFRTLLVQTTNKIYKVEIIADALEWKYIEPNFNAMISSFTLN
jgi:hypothetical protein